MVNKFEKAVQRSKEGWFSKVVRLFDRTALDETLWDELEELLISADVGVATTAKLLGRVKERMGTEGFTEGDQIRSALKEEMVSMLRVNATPAEASISLSSSGPPVV